MRTNIKPENRRLLEALDYLDDAVISSVLAEVKIPAEGSPERDKKATRRSIKYALALAACLVLMSAVIPVVSFLSERFGAGSSKTYELTYPMFVAGLEPLSEEEMMKINEVYEDWKYGRLYESYVSSPIGGSANADQYARNELGDDPHRFFNKEKYNRYQYYGKFGDCVVLATENYFYTLSTFTVAGYVFELGGTADLIVYRNGEMMTLNEAYDSGLMTDAQVAAAHERYLAYMEYLDSPVEQEAEIAIPDYTPPEPTGEPIYLEFMPALEPLTREQMNEIRKAFAEYKFKDRYASLYRQYTALNELDNIEARAYENAKTYADKMIDKLFSGSYYYSRYYGTFGDCVIVACVDYTLRSTEYRLTDTSIVFPQGAEMYVYRDGEITEFGEFYQKGLISEYDALLLSTRHLIYETRARSSYQEDSYLKPIKDVEPLTSEQISDIRSAYGNYVYTSVLNEYTDYFIAQYGEEEGRRMVLIKAGDALIAAGKSLFGDDLNASRYYGIIDNYVVFGIPASMSFPEDPLSSSVPVYVYSFDYKMVFKYSPNMLSEDGNKKLEQRQFEYQEYLLSAPLESIMERYFGKVLYDDEHPLVFTHQTDRCMLICVKSGYEELKKYEIVGYKFVFPYGVNLYVGYNGETYSLYSAHQIGYITEDDMAEIYEAYLDYYEKENR